MVCSGTPVCPLDTARPASNPFADEPANCADFVKIEMWTTSAPPVPAEPDVWVILGFTLAVFSLVFIPYAVACCQCPNYFVNINKVRKIRTIFMPV